MKRMMVTRFALSALALALIGCVRLASNDLVEGERDAGDHPDAAKADVGAPEAGEACVSSCEKVGAFRCSSRAKVQSCDDVSGCPIWRDVAPCPAGHVCCGGVCVEDDVTLPDGCVAPPLPEGYDLYVSASVAYEGGDGTIVQPFRTISRGLLVAGSMAQLQRREIRVYVGSGTYDHALGETFPLVVPGNVTLAGAGAATTLVRGADRFDTAVRGAPASDILFLTMVVGDKDLPTKISGFTIDASHTVPSRVHYGIYCDRGPASTDGGADPPETLLSHVVVGPDYYTAIAAPGPQDGAGCNLRIVGSTILGGQYGVYIPCLSDPIPSVRLALGNDTPEGGNTFKYQTNEDAFGYGVRARCASSITASYNTFANGNFGVSSATTGVVRLRLDHNTFRDLDSAAVEIYGGPQTLDAHDNTFTRIARDHLGQNGTAEAIFISGDSTTTFPFAKLRNNVFSNNDTGIKILAPYPYPADVPTGDFGTFDDPGNNQFHCHHVPGNLFAGGAGAALVIDIAEATKNVDFAFQGNRWDRDAPTRSIGTPANGWPNAADVMIRGDKVGVDLGNPGAKVDGDCAAAP
jgi:hypothetical protein